MLPHRPSAGSFDLEKWLDTADEASKKETFEQVLAMEHDLHFRFGVVDQQGFFRRPTLPLPRQQLKQPCSSNRVPTRHLVAPQGVGEEYLREGLPQQL